MTQGRGRRTGVVLIVLIIIVLLVAVGALFLLRFMQPAPPEAATNGQPTSEANDNNEPEINYINVIVADEDIQRGARLSVEVVRIMQWPGLPEARRPADAL